MNRNTLTKWSTRARTRHPKITHDGCDLSDSGIYVSNCSCSLHSAPNSFDLAQFLGHIFLFFFFSAVPALLLHSHTHLAVALSKRTSFIINKMLISYPLSCFFLSGSFSLVCFSVRSIKHFDRSENYTAIYLFGLFSPFSCYSYFMVDENGSDFEMASTDPSCVAFYLLFADLFIHRMFSVLFSFFFVCFTFFLVCHPNRLCFAVGLSHVHLTGAFTIFTKNHFQFIFSPAEYGQSSHHWFFIRSVIASNFDQL